MSLDTSQNSQASAPLEDAAFWLRHITEFESSQLTRKAYCREHGLNYDRFQYWYRKHARQTKAQAIPVRVKSLDTSGDVLCTLQLGHNRLLIHSPQALSLLLERCL